MANYSVMIMQTSKIKGRRPKSDIGLRLQEKGISQLDIANMLKVKPASVHNVITGKRRTPRIRQAIAFALGRPVAEIWPETTSKRRIP
ncbi:helix-turn-helix domain-containing protein [Desulfofustis limnaeus]|uniref:helix-turn-helix domain-containing protein n=1 Tax=Desulfofustis limnaeus TaxID=2740163 RepID=UPI00338E7D3E